MGTSIAILLVLSSVILALGVHVWKRRRENAVDYAINKVIYELQKSPTRKATPDYATIF